MKLKIYNQSGKLKLTVNTSSSSTWNDELMTENAVSASFTHPFFVQLDVNDYVMLEGIKFSVKKEYKPKQKNRQTYDYSVKFYAPVHDAEQVMYLNLADEQYEPQFSLDGSPREHLQKWVENMNRIYGENRWSIGDVIDAPNETIEYSNTYCWDALSKISEAFGTEWWADGFYMNLCRCERGERVKLGYMKGFTSLVQSENSGDVKFFTRLIPLGSTKNIDRSRYGFSRLQLPDHAKYVDRNTNYGLYEHVESEAFAEIYPHYTGTVSIVRTEEKKGDDGKPFTIYYFKDSGMQFDPCKNEIAGLVKHVSFQTGDLAGRDFEANYNSATKEWEIINTYPDEDRQIPGGNLIPRVGNKYIPWNFRMPVEYEVQAEKDFKAAVDDFLARYSEDISKYGGDTDYTYIDRNAVPLILGQSVRLLSDEYFPGTGYRDSRMTKVTRKLDNLSVATIECTNQVGKGWKKSVDDGLSSLQYVVGETLNRTVVDILKSWDGREPSEYNVFSALRSRAEHLSKKYPDETKYLIKLLGGLVSDDIRSQDFTSGAFGSGHLIKTDPATGRSYLEVDEAYIRLKAVFDILEIHDLSHVGGQIVLSPASMECIKVETASTYYEELVDSTGDVLVDSEGNILQVPVILTVPAGVYRCYFKATDGEKTIANKFAVDDLGQCREFNIEEGVHENVVNQFYWRRVVAIGDDYIDLSIEDCAPGSMTPQSGDTIVTVGNKMDKDRQHVIILSTVGDDAPSIKQYAGIDDYSMAGKEVTVLSPKGNKITGQFIVEAGSSGGENLGGIELPDLEEIKSDIHTAITDASDAQTKANKAQESIDSLHGYVDGAFADGIITEAEAKAIEKYINMVNNTKAAVEATYNKLYMNIYLGGTAKTGLLNAKVLLFGAISDLIASINAAISDGETTVPEKKDVDAKYSAFNNAYASFSTAVEVANQAIQDKLKEYSDEAKSVAEGAVASLKNISQDTKDAVARNLGYEDFSTLQGMAEKGKTIINGGFINTALIEATAIVTAQLIADAIQSNSLNINNKFMIAKDGTFKGVGGELVNMLLTGAFRSPFKSGTFRWQNIPVEMPGVQDNNNVVIPGNDLNGNSCQLPSGIEYDGFSATILNEYFEGVMAVNPMFCYSLAPIYENGEKVERLWVAAQEGIDIQGFSDGTVFRGWIVKNRFKTAPVPASYVTITTTVSPEGAGVVKGGGTKPFMTESIITAEPNPGYVFKHWNSESNTNPEYNGLWDRDKTMTAYFEAIIITHAVRLAVSPEGSGTVSGGGVKTEGTQGVISAVANTGYAFSHWSNGDTRAEAVITWTADETIIAYFVAYTPSMDELLTNAELANATGVELLDIGMVGEDAFLVFLNRIMWNNKYYTSGERRALSFNKGYLSGKLFAGKTYRLTLTFKGNLGSYLIIAIGDVTTFSSGILNDFNDIGGKSVNVETLTGEDQSLTIDITPNRVTTASDAVIFGTEAPGGVIYIKSISLKEI